MKASRKNLVKIFSVIAAVIVILTCFALVVGAEEATTTGTTTAPTTFTGIIRGLFSGTNIALFGAAVAVIVPGLGSAKGVGIVGESASGLLAEDPSQFGKALALQALPMTQGVYGFVAAFLIVFRLGAFSGNFNADALTFAQGGYFFMAALPIAIVGYYSAIRQARVSAAGVGLLAKRPDQLGKAITSAALVETYAIFALLITLLIVFNCPFV